jgi:hypothetical protein
MASCPRRIKPLRRSLTSGMPPSPKVSLALRPIITPAALFSSLLSHLLIPVTCCSSVRDQISQLTPSIINGVNAKPNRYPWMAALFLSAPSSNDVWRNKQFCGGSLIRPNVVMTAGRFKPTASIAAHALHTLLCMSICGHHTHCQPTPPPSLPLLQPIVLRHMCRCTSALGWWTSTPSQ